MKNRFFMLLLLLLLVVSLASCGKKEASVAASPSVEKEVAEKSSELSVLFMSGVYAESAKSMSKEFEDEFNCKVDVSDVPFSSFHEKAMLDLSSGAGSYDIISVNASWLGEFAPFLESMDEFILVNKYDDSDFIPSVLDACRWDGSLYGFPLAPTPNMMTYRTDLIETPPTTYDEYMEMAKAHNDPKNGMYGISIPGKKEQYAVMYLVRSWAMGSDVADENFVIDVDNEVGRAAMRQLGETKKYTDSGSLSWGLEESINAFLQGNAAFCEAWPTLGIVQNADNPDKSKIVGNWALAPFPAEKTGKNQMSLWIVAISKDSKNKEKAYEWLKKYASKDKQLEFFDTYNVLPSLTSFWEDDAVKKTPLAPVGPALENAMTKWGIPVSAELDTIMANSVSSYLAGSWSLDRAMSYFDTELKKAIKDNPPGDVKNVKAIAINKVL
ncbi:MAG: extracellular solute-binding protein [Sphaerochaeta sp.]|nr:extracellular solute-binding protein [Sphaerochaeta sp.]